MESIKFLIPYIKKYRRELALGLTALLVTDLSGLGIPWLIKKFVDFLPDDPSSSLRLKFAGLLLLVAMIQALGRFGWRKYVFGPSRKVECDILDRLFSHLLTLDKNYFQSRKVGDLMSRATNDLRAVRDFVGLGLLILVDSSVVIVSCIFLMSIINPSLTLVVLIPLPLVSILFFKFMKEISKRHRAVQEHLARITAAVQENLAGIRVLHAFVQEENEKRKFAELNREYIAKNLEVTRLFGLFTPSLVFTLGIAAMISLWMGAKAVIGEEMTLGSFVAFNGYLMMLSWPMMGVGYVLNITQKGISAMRRIHEVFSTSSMIQDGHVSEAPIEGNIFINRLSFTYPGASTPALRDVTLQISRGQTVGIVGKVGSGKSTLAQLMVRLYSAPPASINIDGIPLDQFSLAGLRRSIGLVEQDPYLFSMSIRDNIAQGKPGASDEEIDAVVRCAGLLPDLDRFPQGLETMVGERGVSLSGGQKQRIALARALLKQPKILILDDAFSSLDAETEEFILKNIREFIGGITTIIISHRLSFTRHADQIVVLENGRIVEMGTHNELVRSGGIYSNMFHAQNLAREMEMMLR